MTDPHAQYDQPWLSEDGPVHDVEPQDNYERRATLIRVIDADTIEARLDMGGQIQTQDVIRLAWCNAPEHRGAEYPAGHWVTRRLIEKLGSSTDLRIRSRKFSVGKYGRYICDVYSRGVSLNLWLVQNRYAWPATDAGVIIGQRDIERLTGIPEQIRKQVLEAQLA